jgi:cytochrome c peroxidase
MLFVGGRDFRPCASIATALWLAVAAPGCSPESKRTDGAVVHEDDQVLDREPLGVLPPAPSIDPKVAELGRRLFEDKRLSADGSVACASCHDLAHGGVDGTARSRGIHGQLGTINAPTVYNASLNFLLFWDGRAKTLEEQVNGPLTNPLEMGSTWDAAIATLRADPAMVGAFAGAFGSASKAPHDDGPVTPEHLRAAIAGFERTLLTPGAPFDRWLQGDTKALDPDAKEGYQTFKAIGCVACHQGANVGGNMLQRFGVLGDYFKDRGGVTEADYGRFNVTHSEADRFVFRVPSLRNVEYTAPYFHDGSAKTLEAAVQVMARYQLGRSLTPRQVTVLVAFLDSLSGPAAFGTNQ